LSEEFLRLFEKWKKAKGFLVVGKGVRRVDALEKVLGKAKYVEDYFFDGMLYVRLVKSTIPHGRIKKIDVSGALRLPGVVGVFTAKDIPGINQVGYALPDQPLLAEGKVRFHGEVVALVAAEDPDVAEEAARLVKVEYEPLPAVFDPLEAMNSKILVHEERGSNIAETTKVRKGDVEKGFEQADVIVENTYRTGHQDHVYLETEGAVAVPEPGRITVIGSIQYPHLCQTITSRVLGLDMAQVRIVQASVGGAFGGKDDMGPLVTAKAALVAYKTGRPAMLVYTREDSFTSHCKRDPSIIEYKSGATSDGKLTAIQVKIILDSGAYANRGPFVLWRATMHASGPYEVPNAKVDGFLVYTNKVFEGSFRGFGNPQIQFAAESQMDELAEKLGLDPVEIRLRNILKPGSLTITSQKLDHSVGIGEAVKKLAEVSDFKRKWAEYRKDGGVKRRGIGIACGWHGISTSRGVPDWSNAYINIYKDGSVVCGTGICEIGQGTHTAHAQIVSEVLGVPIEHIKVVGGTTDAPDTGATHASRGSSIGGIGIFVAAAKLRERVEKVAAKLLGCTPEEVEIRDGKAFRRGAPDKYVEWRELVKKCYETGVEMSATGYFFLPKGTFDQERGQGFAYPAYSYVVNVAEVEVDMETGQVKVLRVWPALAAGKILNPTLVEGQLEGAIAQGLGYALMEELVFKDGVILNANLTDYVIPTVEDVPEVMKPVYVEDLYQYGPFGAKGVGEMALIPTPAAIINAIYNATGVRIREIPATSEKLYFALKKARG